MICKKLEKAAHLPERIIIIKIIIVMIKRMLRFL